MAIEGSVIVSKYKVWCPKISHLELDNCSCFGHSSLHLFSQRSGGGDHTGHFRSLGAMLLFPSNFNIISVIAL